MDIVQNSRPWIFMNSCLARSQSCAYRRGGPKREQRGDFSQGARRVRASQPEAQRACEGLRRTLGPGLKQAAWCFGASPRSGPRFTCLLVISYFLWILSRWTFGRPGEELGITPFSL